MIRYGDSFVILKEDIYNGYVKKHEYKGLIEYWVYEGKKSKLLSVENKPIILKNTGDAKLKAIIVCEKKHITSDNAKRLLIKGCRFTEKDIDYYRSKKRENEGWMN